MTRQFTLTHTAARCGNGSHRLVALRGTSGRRPRVRRRGVASVLAMMFLVIFGSLAAAMAVVAQGNLRTADSSLKVSRAMSAAETGLIFAARRMQEEGGRFIVEKGVIDETFAAALWSGTLPVSDYVLLPPSYPPPASDPKGIMEAIRDAHLADDHGADIENGDASLPLLDAADGFLIVKPIPLSAELNAPYFRLTYAFTDIGEPTVLVTSEGVDGNIRRVISMEYRIDKKIEYAVLSPNRIMIGKNVMLEGPIGSVYGVGANANSELHTENGDPLVMRSDFYFLDPALDTVLDTFYGQVVLDDADGDARLRPNHPIEGANLGGLPELVDQDGDEYIDDFDLFLAHFDTTPTDGMVVYDAVLAAAAGMGGLTNEFDDAGGEILDLQLCRLIDLARPDRDNDGAENTSSDRGLGYRNGVLDLNDLYAKVTGRLAFAVSRAAWEDPAAHGESYQTVVQGPIRPGLDEAPASFDVTAEDLLEITTDMFNDSHSWFEAQVDAHSGAGLGGGPSENPDLLVNEAIAGGGDPLNYTAPADADWESVPFGSTGAYDHYQRPVYRDMTFENLRIPMGNNGLFVNCTFVGVTWIESERDCNHIDWNYAGAVEPVGDPAVYELRFPDLPPTADILAGDIIADTRAISNNIRFHDCTFLGSIAGDKLDEYTHWRNKVQVTGATRFYVDPADVDPPGQTDANGTLLTDLLGGIAPADLIELSKSSILLPGWSVDVGNFNNEVEVDPDLTATVRLKGVIIAGVLDVRGTGEIIGTLLMTFRPVETQGPLNYGGKPDAFNTTIGYFGPEDGDDEGTAPGGASFEGFGEIRLRYDPDALLPDGIPWPVRMDPDPGTYLEGGWS